MEQKIHANVALLLFPWASEAPYIFVSDILKIITPISGNIYVITGHEERIKYENENVNVLPVKLSVHYAKLKNPLWFSYIWWILKCLLIQLNMGFNLLKVSRSVDIIIYMAYPFNLLPLIIGKICRKKNVELVIRSKEKHHNRLLNIFLQINNILDFRLMDGISPESKSIIKDLGLDKYSEKIVGECSRFVKVDKNVNLKERKNVVGFIGRLRKEKGIIEFIKSIPIILEKRKDIEFLIVGDGDLSDWVESEVNAIKKIHNVNIRFLGWVSREDIYDVLSSIKLLVLPTHAEGLPTIILEAMATGTPILTTNVGGIPDVIVDGKTGYILKNNSPNHISKCVLDALEDPNLEKIVENSRRIVKKKFTYESAVKRWEKIFKTVLE
ncbi:predicted glycosyltransferase [Methanothermobacter marburgensis str. Marburg]|uniref:Predicted glycosyltransferase n=1 Tax=Methanothermobacter marburgensis (strain ATCC BAA-927 / DSM 2133 / JCM 14651 / NBRC 100331 / OCM 82 / Marburg) TaxID=79929 RepID=D9PVW6_METTM|nr:predicted glycosyltransferase [Methanothermobacter marburgensis str. Marburg]